MAKKDESTEQTNLIKNQQLDPGAPSVPPKSTGVKPSTIYDLLNSKYMKDELKKILPKFCTPERFLRVAYTAVNKTPKLQNCTRESLLLAFYSCAELGLEPDGRRAHLIPYGTECQLIIDYKGKAELAMRSGKVANIHADKICEKDDFKYDRGIVVKHVIDFKTDRGKAYAYYILIRMKDGTEKAEVMPMTDIEAIRDRSAAWKAYKKYGKECPWNTDFDEMAKKTVFHRASKWITLSPELRRSEDFEDKDGNYTAALAGPGAVPAIADETGDKPSTEGADGLGAAANGQKGAE